jgi:hypothetical protein
MRRAIIKMKACPRRRRPRSPLRARDRDYCPSNIAHTPLLALCARPGVFVSDVEVDANLGWLN